MTDADVLIVGGGIAGWSAAWFASRRGRDVTLVDEGVHRASDVPVALVNPLRGRVGRLVARGVDGMHATFALVDALRRDGHAIAGARGLYRPLIGRYDEFATEAYWRATIGAALDFDWHDRAPTALGLVECVPSLFLRDAGWVESAGLLGALVAGSRATRIDGRAVLDGIDRVVLADGSAIRARRVLWCGGAWGCALLDDAIANDARYEPGSLATCVATPTREPLSFGLYAVPRDDGMLVGPTREPPCKTWPTHAVPDDAVRHLEDRVARTFGTKIALRPAWRGVRLAHPSSRAAQALAGVPTITALGSRGYLMAPLLAAEWARSL